LICSGLIDRPHQPRHPFAITMSQDAYLQRRGQIEDYFDRTALKAWEQLTSTAPVGRIRTTVRAGRDRKRILDAGCGTGALAVEAAQRGAEVVAIDLSPQLVDVARQRVEALGILSAPGQGRIDWRSGDMLDPGLGCFDHVVAMDSLIHYDQADMLRVLDSWAQRTTGSMVFTFAPANPLLVTLRAMGRLFPQKNRAPWLQPVAEKSLRRGVHHALPAWQAQRTQRVSSGFYTSQALELIRS
jgi:magnesium-protoporphyrin O-methyltransferase